jgi:dihydropteroate synthase
MLHPFFIMGVMNVTPDSFSDGGRSATLDGFVHHLNLLKPYCDVIDIGAESTAPFNDGVTFVQEKERLMPILSYLKTLGQDHFLLSLDSYKPEIAHWFFSELNWSKGIWNDVSGIADESVHDFLKKFPNHHYVLCHTHVPSREQVSNHMSFLNEQAVDVNVIKHFKDADLSSYGKRVVLDPCFGFSKTYEQNLQLIKDFSIIEQSFPEHHFIVGLSKKSFLRKNLEIAANKEELMELSEHLHFDLLKNTFHPMARNHSLWVRLHRPKLAHLAQMSLS